MKVIVYNCRDQYALSRKQIEVIKKILPKEYFQPIKEFHITHTCTGSEVFEYSKENKNAHFVFPVKEKTKEIVSNAVTELLIGLKRIKSSTKWDYPISEREREEYMVFNNEWHSKCMLALQK